MRRGTDIAALSALQALVVHLLHEASKGAGSFWDHYIQQLPHSYTTLCCFPPDAVEALQLPYAMQAARDAAAKAKAEWRGAWPLLQDLGGCNGLQSEAGLLESCS